MTREDLYYNECFDYWELSSKEMDEFENIVYNQALEDFERKMAYFCFGLKASEGNLCRVDIVEDELQRVKRQLIK